MSGLSVEGERWLAASREEWTELLADSRADPLFMSWSWLHAWWTSFGTTVGGAPRIYVARDASNRVVGIAPFYLHQQSSFGLRRNRLTVLGNAWRRDLGVISERLDWICRGGHEDTVAARLAAAMRDDTTWDEAMILFADARGSMCRTLAQAAAEQGWYVRVEGEIDSYCIDTSESLDRYVAGLRPQVRARMFNRRRRLTEQGGVAVSYADVDTLEEYLGVLFRLHETRWGRPVSADARNFLETVCEQAAMSSRLRLSEMSVGGRPLSAVLSLRADAREYNIQSAFDESGARGASPGLLHLGYELERVFGDSGVRNYDLLAGGGKKTEFKRKLAPVSDVFRSLHIVKNRATQGFFRLYDFLKR